MARSRKEVDASTYAGRFAEKIKSVREKRKLTIKDVSEQSGIPAAAATTLYCWEEGRNTPTVENLALLAQIFSTPVPSALIRYKIGIEKIVSNKKIAFSRFPHLKF